MQHGLSCISHVAAGWWLDAMLYHCKSSACRLQMRKNQSSTTSVCFSEWHWTTAIFIVTNWYIMFHVNASRLQRCRSIFVLVRGCAAIFRFRFVSFWTRIIGIIRQLLVYNLYAKYSSLLALLRYITSFGTNLDTQFRDHSLSIPRGRAGKIY